MAEIFKFHNLQTQLYEDNILQSNPLAMDKILLLFLVKHSISLRNTSCFMLSFKIALVSVWLFSSYSCCYRENASYIIICYT